MSAGTRRRQTSEHVAVDASKAIRAHEAGGFVGKIVLVPDAEDRAIG